MVAVAATATSCFDVVVVFLFTSRCTGASEVGVREEVCQGEPSEQKRKEGIGFCSPVSPVTTVHPVVSDGLKILFFNIFFLLSVSWLEVWRGVAFTLGTCLSLSRSLVLTCWMGFPSPAAIRFRSFTFNYHTVFSSQTCFILLFFFKIVIQLFSCIS